MLRGVEGVLFVTETAQVELKRTTIEAPAGDIRARRVHQVARAHGELPLDPRAAPAASVSAVRRPDAVGHELGRGAERGQCVREGGGGRVHHAGAYTRPLLSST